MVLALTSLLVASQLAVLTPVLGTSQVFITVSYQLVGGGNLAAGALLLTPPVFHYTLNGKSESEPLTEKPYMWLVDVGTYWTVTPFTIPGSSGERWQPSGYSNFNGLGGVDVVTSPATYVFTYYHQYLETLSYAVFGGAPAYAAPTFTANRFGFAKAQILTTTPTGYWFDASSAWSETNPLASTYTERWFASQATSGTIAGGSTTMFTYQHQYYLTMLASPSGAGYVTAAIPGGSCSTNAPQCNGTYWYNVGQTVTLTANGNNGNKFLGWTGTGTGSTGPTNDTSNPATITMNSAITETATFS